MENVAEPVVLAGTPAPEKEKGLTGSTLKIIAIVTMFIVHAGAVLVERYLDSKGADLIPQVGQMDEETMRLALVSLLDFLMRMIGRIRNTRLRRNTIYMKLGRVIECYKCPKHVYIFQALLKYSSHVTLCIFKVYSMMK